MAARLVQRQKDSEKAIRARAAEFHATLVGLRDAFGAAVVEVDGSVPPKECLAGLEVVLQRPNAHIGVIGMAGSAKLCV